MQVQVQVQMHFLETIQPNQKKLRKQIDRKSFIALWDPTGIFS